MDGGDDCTGSPTDGVGKWAGLWQTRNRSEGAPMRGAGTALLGHCTSKESRPHAGFERSFSLPPPDLPHGPERLRCAPLADGPSDERQPACAAPRLTLTVRSVICVHRKSAVHGAMQTSLEPWDYSPEASTIGPRGGQFGDDPGRPSSATAPWVAGGQAGARGRASGCAWWGSATSARATPPGARAGRRRGGVGSVCARRLVRGGRGRTPVPRRGTGRRCEIFVPMVPLTDSTRA